MENVVEGLESLISVWLLSSWVVISMMSAATDSSGEVVEMLKVNVLIIEILALQLNTRGCTNSEKSTSI